MEKRPSNLKRAFTLLELLVVIAVIAILAALLLPVLGRAKQSAYRVQCINNLKQLSIAINNYADEHGDSLPGPVWQGLFHDYDNQNTLMMPYYIATYLSQPAPSPAPQVLGTAICPASMRTWQTSPYNNPQMTLSQPISYIVSISVTNFANDLVSRPFGYPYESLPNGGGTTNEPSKHLKEIGSPSTSWAIVDADQQNAVPLATYYPYIPSAPIHKGARNELFFDWHIESVKE